MIEIVVASVALCAVLAVLIFFLTIRNSRRVEELLMREKVLQAEMEMLSHASRMTSEFYQNMSHDFKTPLTVISTSIHNAADLVALEGMSQADMVEIKTSLYGAQSEVMRLARLVGGAAQLAFLYDGKQEFKPLDIVQLLDEMARNYKVLFERSGNTLTVNAAKDLPMVQANADMLTHVIANLLSNANRHTKNGNVSMEVAVQDEVVVVTIKDSGIGIAPNLIERVFERGVTTRRHTGGAGLGLSICKKIIEEAHGGKIWAESVQGEGTSIKFTLKCFR